MKRRNADAALARDDAWRTLCEEINLPEVDAEYVQALALASMAFDLRAIASTLHRASTTLPASTDTDVEELGGAA